MSHRDENKTKPTKMDTARRIVMLFGFGMMIMFLFETFFASDDGIKVSQKLCDQTMDMMGNEYHTAMHENYPETMVQLHLIIDACHEKGFFPDDGTNDSIGMPNMGVR